MFTEMKTFDSVFGNSYYFALKSPKTEIMQNITFVGYNSDKRIDFSELDVAAYDDEIIASLSKKLVDTSKIDFSPYPIFTDNYSPTEFFSIIGVRGAFMFWR